MNDPFVTALTYIVPLPTSAAALADAGVRMGVELAAQFAVVAIIVRACRHRHAGHVRAIVEPSVMLHRPAARTSAVRPPMCPPDALDETHYSVREHSSE